MSRSRNRRNVARPSNDPRRGRGVYPSGHSPLTFLSSMPLSARRPLGRSKWHRAARLLRIPASRPRRRRDAARRARERGPRALDLVAAERVAERPPDVVLVAIVFAGLQMAKLAVGGASRDLRTPRRGHGGVPAKYPALGRAAAAPAEYPRRGRGAAATRLPPRGISTSRPRRRRDPPSSPHSASATTTSQPTPSFPRGGPTQYADGSSEHVVSSVAVEHLHGAQRAILCVHSGSEQSAARM